MAYLSGAIEHAPDGGRAWRQEMTEWLKDRLGHDAFNPALDGSILTPEEAEHFRGWRQSDFPRFKMVVRRIIERDLRAIDREIDYVICFWDGGAIRGGGTHGEITIAYYLGKEVYLVLGMPRSKVSSWILGCATRDFEDFQELKAFLEKEYGI